MADERNRGKGRGRRNRGWAEGGRANPESGWREEPESWVGRPTGGGYQGGRDPGTPYGVPQGWRSEDNYTLSPDRQRGERDPGYGRGPFTGRGPEGYTRSDERIREDVCDRLTEHGGIDASGIRVAVEKGEVILEGTVQERVEKWMAEEVADAVAGVRDVQNRIRLRGRGGERG